MCVPKRLQDVLLEEFEGVYLVECPRCAAVAQATKNALTCSSCGYSRSEKRRFPGYVTYFYGLDPLYGQPLWLRGHCREGVVWAYNWRHLLFLEATVAAEQRRTSSISPPSRSHIRRLPKWLMAAKNRGAVLRCIRQIKKRRGS
jgi:hypothetical protein